jgi:Integrin beta chain VWA domain
MASTGSDQIRTAVLNAVSDRIKGRPSILATTTVAHPDTGAELTAATVVDADQPNSPAHFVVVDDAGHVVELGALRRAGLDPFAPPVFTVAPEVVAGHSVTIDPPRDDLALSECDVVTEKIVVTIPVSGVVSKADVYFLADTTLSMEPVLSAVQSGASTILTALVGLGIDIALGVGNYKDFPTDPYAFQHQLNPTSTASDVQNAINTWSASGGGDIPEAGFFALTSLAEPAGGPIGWRPDSTRIIVWFGDAPAHDPVCAAISGIVDITEASVTAKLVGEKITVLAISTTTGTPDALDADPVPLSTDYGACGAPGGAAGQATRIATATGGVHAANIDPTGVVTTIIDLIKAAVGSIKNVRLVADGDIVPFVTSIEPAAGYGPLRGDTEHVLEFVVTFTGGAVDCEHHRQIFNGSLDVIADGATVASKPTRITVPACEYTYAVKFVCGTQEDCGCDCTPVRPGAYATEINVHNSRCHTAQITLRVNSLVLAGAPAGRFPNVVPAKSVATFTLAQGEATMVDCCRINEFLLGAAPSGDTPASIGFLEITSDQELDVAAVYTTTGPDGHSHSMTVIDVDAAAH